MFNSMTTPPLWGAWGAHFTRSFMIPLPMVSPMNLLNSLSLIFM